MSGAPQIQPEEPENAEEIALLERAVRARRQIEEVERELAAALEVMHRLREAVHDGLHAIDDGGRASHPQRMSDREIDAKIEAAEARTDTKFAQLLGRIDTTNMKIDQIGTAVAGTRSLILGILMPTIVGGFIAIFFGLFALLQWADARMFGMAQIAYSAGTAAESAQMKPAIEPAKPPPADAPKP